MLDTQRYRHEILMLASDHAWIRSSGNCENGQSRRLSKAPGSANDRHHRNSASDASIFNSAPAAIPVHAIVSTPSRTLAACKCDCIERSGNVLDETVSCGREILNPAICDLTAHICSESTRAVFGVNAAAPCKGRLRLCSAEKNGKTDTVVQTRHPSPRANISPDGHIMSQPPRHAQLVRVDSRSSVVSKCDSSAFRRTRCQPAKRRAIKCERPPSPGGVSCFDFKRRWPLPLRCRAWFVGCSASPKRIHSQAEYSSRHTELWDKASIHGTCKSPSGRGRSDESRNE